MSIFKIILACIFLINIAFSQKDTIPKAKKSKIDSLYIENVSNHLSVRVYNIWKNSDIIFTNIETNKSLILSPNNSVDLGLEFDYKWLGFGLDLGINKISNDDSIYGKTNRFDFQFSLYGTSYGFDAHFQKYKGFYFSNAKIYADTTMSIYPQLNDMELYSAGISAYYLFNYKKFSYKAAYVRNEIQKKGQGSIILGAYYNINSATNKTGFTSDIIPDSIKSLFNITSFTAESYGLNFGYTYTFIIGKIFFINLSVSPGIGFAKANIITSTNTINNKPLLSTNYIAKLSIGLEKRSFYFGLTAFANGYAYNYETTKIQPSTSNMKFFFGKRFGMKKRKINTKQNAQI